MANNCSWKYGAVIFPKANDHFDGPTHPIHNKLHYFPSGSCSNIIPNMMKSDIVHPPATSFRPPFPFSVCFT